MRTAKIGHVVDMLGRLCCYAYFWKTGRLLLGRGLKSRPSHALIARGEHHGGTPRRELARRRLPDATRGAGYYAHCVLQRVSHHYYFGRINWAPAQARLLRALLAQLS
jgi:hypothetical protein